MSKVEYIKQGVELEGYVQNRDKMTQREGYYVHDRAVNSFRGCAHHKYYTDDGKPEFPSEPRENLKDLTVHVKDVIGRALDECKRRFS